MRRSDLQKASPAAQRRRVDRAWQWICDPVAHGLSTRAVEISVDGKLHPIARAETGQRFFLDWPTHAHLMLEAPARRPFVARNLFTARVPLSARMARASRGSLAPW